MGAPDSSTSRPAPLCGEPRASGSPTRTLREHDQQALQSRIARAVSRASSSVSPRLTGNAPRALCSRSGAFECERAHDVRRRQHAHGPLGLGLDHDQMSHAVLGHGASRVGERCGRLDGGRLGPRHVRRTLLAALAGSGGDWSASARTAQTNRSPPPALARPATSTQWTPCESIASATVLRLASGAQAITPWCISARPSPSTAQSCERP